MSGRWFAPGFHPGLSAPVPYAEFKPCWSHVASDAFPLVQPITFLRFSDMPLWKIVVDGPDSAVKMLLICQPPAVSLTRALLPFSSGKGTMTLPTKIWGRLICVLPLSKLGLKPLVRVCEPTEPLASSNGTLPIE